MAGRLTLERITEATAHLPEPDRTDARILLACVIMRREVRALRRKLGITETKD